MKRTPNIVLYTRRGCHLCDEARELLNKHNIEPVLIDVDTDFELRQRFGNEVPVVEIEGRVRFRGRIESLLLKRILASGE